MRERDEAMHVTCRVCCVNTAWHMCRSDVWTTCGQRGSDVVKMSAH